MEKKYNSFVSDLTFWLRVKQNNYVLNKACQSLDNEWKELTLTAYKATFISRVRQYYDILYINYSKELTLTEYKCTFISRVRQYYYSNWINLVVRDLLVVLWINDNNYLEMHYRV